MPSFQALSRRLHHMAEGPWVPVLLVFIAAMDFIVLLIPSDLFLIAAILGYERRRNVFVGSMLLGRLGSVIAVHTLSQRISIETLQGWVAQFHMENAWEKGQYFFEKFGPLSIGITALSPFPMIFPTFLSGFAGAPVWQTIFFAMAGSLIRYILLCVSLQAGKELYSKYLKA